MRNPEEGGIGFYPTTAVTIEIPEICSATSEVYAHELGHAHGLHDHYTEGIGDCSNNYGIATIMDCPGYTTVQTHDNWDVLMQYRTGPIVPDNRVASAQAFNKVRLTWQDRSHNERRFRIERGLAGPPYTFLANLNRIQLPPGTGSFDNLGTLVAPNTNYCYQIRGEGDFSNNGSFGSMGCSTTPHSVGTVSGMFNGSNVSLCAGRVSGSGTTQYKFVAYRWSTGQLLTWTVNDNQSCYGAVLLQTSLANDYYHFAVAGCNSNGCSDYRDMSNPYQYWTQMPGGASGGSNPNTNYHAH